MVTRKRGRPRQRTETHVRLTIELPELLLAALDARAQERQVSRTTLVLGYLRAGLDASAQATQQRPS